MYYRFVWHLQFCYGTFFSDPAHLVSLSLGCILTGPLTHAIGRRMCMKLVTIPFLIGWLLLHFSTTGWQIFVAFCILGLAGGLLEAPVSTYLNYGVANLIQ